MSFLEHELAAARLQSQEKGAILKAIVAWHDSFTGRGSEFSDEGPYSKFSERVSATPRAGRGVDQLNDPIHVSARNSPSDSDVEVKNGHEALEDFDRMLMVQALKADVHSLTERLCSELERKQVRERVNRSLIA